MAADVLAQKNASDIVLLSVGEALGITEAFVIATGRSRPHIQSLAEDLKKRLREEGRPRLGEEGLATAEWVLLDYGDFVVHIFSPEHRVYYGLERLWVMHPKSRGHLRLPQPPPGFRQPDILSEGRGL